MTTGRQLITSALRKLGANSANAVPTAEDMDVAKEALNSLIDSKSNSLLNIHTITPHRFPLTAGQYVYTLGPTGDWETERPMRTEKVRLIMNPSSTNVTPCIYPLNGTAPLTVYFASPCPGNATASFTFEADEESRETIYFTYTGEGAMAWLWDFGDGATSTEENPTHVYSSSGTYTVTLTVINADGATTAQQDVEIVNWFFSYLFFYNVNTMAYQTEILNWLHTQSPYLDALNYGQGLNATTVPAGGAVLAGNIAKINNWTTNNAIIGLRSMGSASAYGYVYQFEVYEPKLGANTTYFFGYWTQAYGPPFDPDSPYGGPFASTIESDGTTSWVNQYGGGGATGLPGFGPGDFVTCIYVPDTSYVNFFINGSWVANANIANTDGYAISGSNPGALP
jgi:PKD repeat protein